jgi:transposase
LILDWTKTKIFLKPGVTDFRKQINGLSAIIENESNFNLFKGFLFIFCNRSRNRIKILYWDKNGFCLWLKRLEKDKFPWPKNEQEVRQISLEELKMLLNGINFFNTHKKLNYTSVS